MSPGSGAGRMTAQEKTAAREKMIRTYDRTMVRGWVRNYYEDSGFFNFGYWRGSIKTQRQACEALVDRLLERIPRREGRILDVACGLGASTRHLTRSYPPHMITAINISSAQIAAARKRAPGCSFGVMDATQLDFPDAHFDAVICVEAAFHFDTRAAFLREALRVLKPGGTLVMSDILFRQFLNPAWVWVARANVVADIPGYRRHFEAAGFAAIDIEDATEACLGGFRRNLVRWGATERASRGKNYAERVGLALALRLGCRMDRRLQDLSSGGGHKAGRRTRRQARHR